MFHCLPQQSRRNIHKEQTQVFPRSPLKVRFQAFVFKRAIPIVRCRASFSQGVGRFPLDQFKCSKARLSLGLLCPPQLSQSNPNLPAPCCWRMEAVAGTRERILFELCCVVVSEAYVVASTPGFPCRPLEHRLKSCLSPGVQDPQVHGAALRPFPLLVQISGTLSQSPCSGYSAGTPTRFGELEEDVLPSSQATNKAANQAEDQLFSEGSTLQWEWSKKNFFGQRRCGVKLLRCSCRILMDENQDSVLQVLQI